MSNTELAISICEWLERRGYDQVSRALKRDAGLPGGKLNPIVQLQEFSEQVNKDINKKFISFRNDSYRNDFEHDKNEKKRKAMSGGDNDEIYDDENDTRQEKRSNNHGQPATPLPPPGAPTNRLFLGNLAFKITESKIHSFFADCGEISNIQWVTDKTTGQFYGTAFIEFENEDGAHKALSKNGKKCMERPIKINYCGHRQQPNQNDNGQKKMPPAPKWSEKPDECKTLFMGNLSFDIQEEQVRAFFGHCGEIYDIRWSYRDDGEFKGIGWIEFANEDALQKAVKLHGKALCGRPVRLDYA